jgi:hypothetical protein
LEKIRNRNETKKERQLKRKLEYESDVEQEMIKLS